MIQIIAPDEILHYAAFFLAEQMGVEIIDAQVIIAGGLSDNLSGACIDLGDHIQVAINNEITDPFELFEVLAHEMVHVAQILRGDLSDGPDDIIYWKGRTFRDPKPGSKRYYNVPWEKEAYAKQESLTLSLFADEKFLLTLETYAAKRAIEGERI